MRIRLIHITKLAYVYVEYADDLVKLLLIKFKYFLLLTFYWNDCFCKICKQYNRYECVSELENVAINDVLPLKAARFN